MTTSPTQRPPAHQCVADWERGVDPWHADAFVGTPGETYGAKEPRKSGWLAIEWTGNVLGFVADGTEYKETAE